MRYGTLNGCEDAARLIASELRTVDRLRSLRHSLWSCLRIVWWPLADMDHQIAEPIVLNFFRCLGGCIHRSSLSLQTLIPAAGLLHNSRPK